MLVFPFLVGAVVALVTGRPWLTVGLICLAVCDWAGALAQRDLERKRERRRA